MKPLTARGVKNILTRAGVDYSRLVIRNDPGVWTNLQTGYSTTSVVIEGPKSARWEAAGPLYDAQLACAPYTEFDMWSRPGPRSPAA